jgi:putative DNA primase/helicase
MTSRQTRPNLSRERLALRYARSGWLVLPMHTIKDGKCSCSKGNACERAGKHPITAHGVNDATTNRSRIRNWWAENPDANIGIAAGSESGIIVLDIDPRNGGYKSLKRLKRELGPLPDTVTAVTGGGGRHLVFKYPSFAVRKDTRSARTLPRGQAALTASHALVRHWPSDAGDHQPMGKIALLRTACA